jgi:hypothetical protein
MNKNKFWFTLIEIMVWILIVSLVIIWWFQALSAVTIWKVRLIQQTDIQKESFYFTERLFEMIKKWWLIDFEEYFNRKVIWNTSYSSWHFDIASWFGNFWTWWVIWTNSYGWWFYYCRSWDWIVNKLTWSWCYDNNFNTNWSDVIWEQQRYGQYSFQFIDYNSNYDNDLWDEDWDGELRWDDDDEYLWEWPNVFNWWVDLTELYLISWNKKERTLFRWNVELDPDAPSSETCLIDSSTNEISWDGCIWTIEYLKLEWKDRWMDHNLTWNTYLDWVIDTWLIDKNFVWWAEVVAGTWTIKWVKLFPNTINVSEFEIYGYPNKDINYAWKNTDPEVNISPYVELKVSLKPSWISRKKIKWAGKELDFSMTISLSDIYSQ